MTKAYDQYCSLVLFPSDWRGEIQENKGPEDDSQEEEDEDSQNEEEDDTQEEAFELFPSVVFKENSKGFKFLQENSHSLTDSGLLSV